MGTYKLQSQECSSSKFLLVAIDVKSNSSYNQTIFDGSNTFPAEGTSKPFCGKSWKLAVLALLAFRNFSYRTEAPFNILQICINRPRQPKVAIRLLIKMSHFISGVLVDISHRKIVKNHQFWCRVVMGPPPTPLHPTPFASHAVHPQIAILPFIEQHPFHHLDSSHLHKICIILQNNENG